MLMSRQWLYTFLMNLIHARRGKSTYYRRTNSVRNVGKTFVTFPWGLTIQIKSCTKRCKNLTFASMRFLVSEGRWLPKLCTDPAVLCSMLGSISRCPHLYWCWCTLSWPFWSKLLWLYVHVRFLAGTCVSLSIVRHAVQVQWTDIHVPLFQLLILHQAFQLQVCSTRGGQFLMRAGFSIGLTVLLILIAYNELI